MEVIGIREAQSKGLGKLLKLAESSGMVVITSNKQARGILMPLSIAGLRTYFQEFSEMATSESIKDMNEGEKEVVQMIDRSFRYLLQESKDKATLF